jgi:acetyltransferase-like isoleucine patch superfamily enzyme
MITYLYNYYKQLHLSNRYKEVRIGKRTVIDKSTTIEKGVIIGNNTFITKANIKSPSKIDDNNMLSNVTINSYSYISKQCKLNNLTIGKFNSIGPEVISGLGMHPSNLLSTSPVFYSILNQCGISFSENSLYDEFPNTTIGNDVWIGARAYLKDGISIGDGAIIAAGAIVTKDVPPYAIVGGVPAKILKYRFSAPTIKSLLSMEWWNWSTSKINKNIHIFQHQNPENLISNADFNI